MLYGDSEEQQEAALAAPDPTKLPWIAAALTRLSQILTDLANPAPRATSSPGQARRTASRSGGKRQTTPD